MSERQYLSCADTAKLIRQALKEAFPGVKFSVRSSVYSGGASIRIEWVDGPSRALIEAMISPFEGAYFDGMIDYKGARYATLDGKPVRFGADFIFAERRYSDAMIERELAKLWKWGGFQEARPSVEDYRQGRLWSWKVDGWDGNGLGREFNVRLQKSSDRLGAKPSPTAARVKFTGDDNYPAKAAQAQQQILAARALDPEATVPGMNAAIAQADAVIAKAAGAAS